MVRKSHGPRELSIKIDLSITGHIEVRFTDTGPGIHKKHWEKIFARGFSTRGGSGLGLFISKQFVGLLGGHISVEQSFILWGTTFLVELPTQNKGDIK
jgi:signal transduction histidine kinase